MQKNYVMSVGRQNSFITALFAVRQYVATGADVLRWMRADNFNRYVEYDRIRQKALRAKSPTR